MDELKKKLEELKKDNKVIKDYIKCFYDIEKVKETYSENEDFKKIEEYLNNEE